MDLKYMSTEEKISIARRFREDHPSGELTREQFDIYIIDHKLADDPGTDDITSQAWKGFTGNRSRVKNLLNSWATKLPPEEAYQIASLAGGTILRLTNWDEVAYDTAADVGASIGRAAQARLNNIQRLAKVATEHTLLASSAEAAIVAKRIKLVTLKSAKLTEMMEREVMAIVHKYDHAFNTSETEVEDIIASLDHDGDGDAGSNAA